MIGKFQHTAARRRLRETNFARSTLLKVSTHSRSKAAAQSQQPRRTRTASFNTQPLEGGCFPILIGCEQDIKFQHTAARRRLLGLMRVARALYRFNTQPLEGGCALTNSDKAHSYGFNTQPLEGGCSLYKKMIKISKLFTVFRYPLKYKEYQEV